MAMARREHHRRKAIEALCTRSIKAEARRMAVDALKNTFDHLARGLALDATVSRRLATTIVDSLTDHVLHRPAIDDFVDYLTAHVLEAVDALIKARLVEYRLIAAPKRSAR